MEGSPEKHNLPFAEGRAAFDTELRSFFARIDQERAPEATELLAALEPRIEAFVTEAPENMRDTYGEIAASLRSALHPEKNSLPASEQ